MTNLQLKPSNQMEHRRDHYLSSLVCTFLFLWKVAISIFAFLCKHWTRQSAEDKLTLDNRMFTWNINRPPHTKVTLPKQKFWTKKHQKAWAILFYTKLKFKRLFSAKSVILYTINIKHLNQMWPRGNRTFSFLVSSFRFSQKVAISIFAYSCKF